MDEVLKFMSDHNRPFTLNDIIQGSGQKLGKSKVLSIVNELIAENRVIEKNCGKQKIYCVAQKSALPLKDVSSNILDLDRQSNSAALKLKEVEADLENRNAKMKQFEGVLTKEEALRKKQVLEEEIRSFQTELESFQGKTYDKKEKAEIERSYTTVLKEYNKRKRTCMDMVDAIFENYPKSKKTLLQEIGIETDDDVNFQLKIK